MPSCQTSLYPAWPPGPCHRMCVPTHQAACTHAACTAATARMLQQRPLLRAPPASGRISFHATVSEQRATQQRKQICANVNQHFHPDATRALSHCAHLAHTQNSPGSCPTKQKSGRSSKHETACTRHQPQRAHATTPAASASCCCAAAQSRGRGLHCRSPLAGGLEVVVAHIEQQRLCVQVHSVGRVGDCVSHFLSRLDLPQRDKRGILLDSLADQLG